MASGFNLLESPWIPVRFMDGSNRLLGIDEVLKNAHEIKCLVISSPIEEGAVVRLLLAIIHRALKGPEHEAHLARIFEKGRFEKGPLNSYLKEWHDRFFLFHDETPFMQIADMPVEKELAWTKLMPEFASGNNPTLFDHSFDDDPVPVGPEMAARALLAHQSFVTGGLLRRYGVGSAKGGPLALSALFVVQGENLFQTLVFNLYPYNPSGDRPIWEADPVTFSDVKDYSLKWELSGRTRIYSWLSRAVRLLEEDGKIRWMLYGPGIDPVEGMLDPDPMCAYKPDKQGALRAVRFSEEKAFWRDFQALCPPTQEGAGRLPPRVMELPLLLTDALVIPVKVLGQVTDQAKVLSIRREIYPIPRAIADIETAGEIELALEHAEELGRCLVRVSRILSSELLSIERSPDPAEVSNLSKNLPMMTMFWSELDQAFPQYLVVLADDADKAWKVWMQALRQAAYRAWDVTRRSVGTKGRHLKAMNDAERRFRLCIFDQLGEG